MATGKSGICWSLSLMLSWGASAWASTLDFNVSPAAGQGSVAYGGGATPLVATGLGVSSITGTDTPVNLYQILNLTGGQLSFVTGAFTGTAGGTEWKFAPGGSIAVIGGLPSLGIASGSVLLAGSFTDTTFLSPLTVGNMKILGSGFRYLVNPRLASYFGLPTGTTTDMGGISANPNAPGSPGAAFASDGLTSGHLVTSPVPEPGMIALYASTLLVLTIWGRRWSLAHRAA